MLVEQIAIDVRERGERFVEICLALFRRGVEDFKEPGELFAQVRAVRSGAIFEEKMERFALENAGVLGEQAEEDADKKAFQVVAGVAARLRAS